ncbi:MAG TPA: hypothetical protein VK146_05535, partial [Tabrizicola sp.]|nr:hypothetical protein [Tabrizicola sp.]
MTKRKDPEPEANVPQDQSTIEPVAPEAIAADPVAGEPFVVTYSSDPPPAPEPTSPEPAPQVV